MNQELSELSEFNHYLTEVQKKLSKSDCSIEELKASLFVYKLGIKFCNLIESIVKNSVVA